jgi:hypothetical protein
MRESKSHARHRSFVLALVVLGSSLGACDWDRPRTTTHRSSADASHAEKLRVKTWTDHARFECLESTTGPCVVTVYTSRCDLDGPADLAPACHATRLRDFRLTVGEARDVAGLPADYRWCMRHGATGEAFCRRS